MSSYVYLSFVDNNMERNLKGKVALVTGAADGIGYGIADQFLGKGAKSVIIIDINGTKGTEAALTLNNKYGVGRAVFIQHDVSKNREELVKKVLKSYRVDVVVNNAGVLAEWSIDKTVEVNITAVMDLTYRFWDYMRKDKGGHGGTIINVASIYGFRVSPFIPVYHGSKFAVLAFSKSLGHAYNYKKSGVRVLAVCPGITETNMAENVTTRENDFSLQGFKDYLNKHDWQKPIDFGRGTVEAYENGDSGTAWVIEGGRPAVECKECYVDDPLCAN